MCIVVVFFLCVWGVVVLCGVLGGYFTKCLRVGNSALRSEDAAARAIWV